MQIVTVSSEYTYRELREQTNAIMENPDNPRPLKEVFDSLPRVKETYRAYLHGFGQEGDEDGGIPVAIVQHCATGQFDYVYLRQIKAES